MRASREDEGLRFAGDERSAGEVPARSVLWLCIGSGSLHGSASREAGSDSPVTVALFTRTPNASTSRQSAGRMSPASSRIRSPGTRSLAGSSRTAPERMTFVAFGKSFLRAASACPARYACQNENTPLIKITPTIANPSVAIPCPGSRHSAKNASAAAIHRMIAKKCANSLARVSNSASRATSSTSFAPNSTRRLRASASLSPVSPLFILAKAPATVRR